MTDTPDSYGGDPMPEDPDELDQAFRDLSIDHLEPTPDGWYVVRVERAEVKAVRAGHDALHWGMVILGPTHVGRKLTRFNSWATTERACWTKHDLKVAGVQPERFTDYSSWVHELVGIVLEVRVKTGDRGTFVHLLRRMEAPPEAPSSDGTLPAF